jgi:hypothetical protein
MTHARHNGDRKIPAPSLLLAKYLSKLKITGFGVDNTAVRMPKHMEPVSACLRSIPARSIAG